MILKVYAKKKMFDFDTNSSDIKTSIKFDFMFAYVWLQTKCTSAHKHTYSNHIYTYWYAR